MTIGPVTHPTAGSPYCGGFRVTLMADGAEPFACDFEFTYFRAAAEAGSTSLVEKGVLQKGDKFQYRVAAYPQPTALAPKPRFAVQEVEAPLPLREGRLAEFTGQSVPVGELLEEDMPVYFAQEVIEQANTLTERAREKETGGILIGHLHRDAAIPDIGAVITAQVPVKFAQAKSTELTFTPKTWASARDTIALRGRGEIMLGWWHSHPARYWAETTCAKCPPERRAVCPVSRNFFSSDDIHLHETIFPKAFNVALVVTNTEGGLQQALFGWNSNGLVRQRGFFIQRHPTRPLEAVAAVATPGELHEPSCT